MNPGLSHPSQAPPGDAGAVHKRSFSFTQNKTLPLNIIKTVITSIVWRQGFSHMQRLSSHK